MLARRFNTLIFDLDGTLVHSLPEYRYRVVENILKDLGKMDFYPNQTPKEF